LREKGAVRRAAFAISIVLIAVPSPGLAQTEEPTPPPQPTPSPEPTPPPQTPPPEPTPTPQPTPRPEPTPAPETTPTPEEAPATEPQPAPERFGDRGWFVITGAVDAAYSSTSYTLTTLTVKRFVLSPSVDYFVAKDISLGLALGYEDQSSHIGDATGYYGVDTKQTTLTAALRGGYLIPLGQRFSLWPVVTVGVASQKQDTQETQAQTNSEAGDYGRPRPSVSATLAYAKLEATLLFHPARHFFIGAGPYAARDAALDKDSASLESSVFGAELLVGGDFGGPRAAEPEPTGFEPPPQPKPQGPRFGHRNSFVLSNDLVLSAAATVPASQSTFAAQPSVDWFFVEHLSLGASTSFSYAYDSKSTLHAIGYGGGLRFGGDIPLASALSLFPRGGFTASQLTGTIPEDTTVVTLGAYIPVLFHPEPHFFVGFGPSASTELVHHISSSPGSPQKATTLGLGMTVGGWL